MASRRTAKRTRLVIVPIIGIFDEEWNLIGEEAGGEVMLYHPYDEGVAAVMGLAERSVQQRLDEDEVGLCLSD